jgi:TatD DNase family protein
MLIDIHSHEVHSKTGQIQFLTLDPSSSLFLLDYKKIIPLHANDVFLSLGIHPWKTLNWDMVNIEHLKCTLSNPHISLIGEIGLDKVYSVPIEKQQIVYETQLKIADYSKKPVILHVVHTMTEIIASQKKYPNIPAWIIHGFMGGKQEAEQYIAKGFYLSFGSKYRDEGLRFCPLDRLFLETDDSDVEISTLYLQVANQLECTVKQLEHQIEINFRKIFPNLL